MALLEKEIRSQGYFMMMRCVEIIPLFSSWNVDGMIFFGAFRDEVAQIRERVDVPVVYIDTYAQDLPIANVGIDDYKGGYLVCEDVVYFYTQKEITTYIPDQTYDFVLLADYVQPEWVKEAVFYQIFPERFCNGDPSNDVKTGEYSQNGFSTIAMDSWNAKPLTYQEGHCLDFYGGDLQGVKEKIPYLKELGITAV